MSAKVFLDTNVLVYAAGSDDLSVQVLNEFANIARRKLNDLCRKSSKRCPRCEHYLGMSADNERTHEAAVRIAEPYGRGLDNSLIIASALEANCSILLSEDMHDDQLLDGRLTIRNPFR